MGGGGRGGGARAKGQGDENGRQMVVKKNQQIQVQLDAQKWFI